jgi:hypothetical protein
MLADPYASIAAYLAVERFHDTDLITFCRGEYAVRAKTHARPTIGAAPDVEGRIPGNTLPGMAAPGTVISAMGTPGRLLLIKDTILP